MQPYPLSMNVSIADIFEDYVESLQNLPAEIDQNMHELRSMDEEFQRLREKYTRHRRSYAKMLRSDTTPASTLAASSLQLDKEHRKAIQKQDQKIDLAKHMYERVSKHIERIDSEIARTGIIDNAAWIGSVSSSGNGGGRRLPIVAAPPAIPLLPPLFDKTRSSPALALPAMAAAAAAARKRTHHSTRPNPAAASQGGNGLAELDIDPNEPRYCICNQVSYGDMVACDSENCGKEWFHYACVGLVEPPVGKWFCRNCTATAQQ